MFSLSGLLLLFPFYVTTIAGMQIARRVRGHRDEVDQLSQGTLQSVARRAACEGRDSPGTVGGNAGRISRRPDHIVED
jgi:hypothetical protein